MSQTTLPSDKLDDLLSDFFKSKLRQPWPAAPTTHSAEPSALHAARRTASQGNRARVTLAASVAILFGACWYFSNGSNTDRAPTPVPSILGDGSATMPKEFEKTKKIEPMGGLPGGPMLN